MRFYTFHSLVLVPTIWLYTLAAPVTESGGDVTPIPIAFEPAPPSLQSNGIKPDIIYLKKEDLLAPDTVVEGRLGPAGPANDVEKRDVIGPDNRFLQVKSGNPWDYIGRFTWPDATGINICTASLVGPRHLVTARHCINQNSNQITYTFSPNYDQGSRGYITARVTTLMYIREEFQQGCKIGDDWAVAILDQRIGDRYGYFGVRNFDNSKAGRPDFWHEGYPSDLGAAARPYVQDRITGRQDNGCNNGATGAIITDADVVGGHSGGPMWLLPEADGVRYLYGVCSSGNPVATFFAGRVPFVNAVANARRDFP